MQREGVFREMKRRRFYEKPSEKSNGNKLKQSAAPASSSQEGPSEGLIAHHAQDGATGQTDAWPILGRARIRLNGEAICSAAIAGRDFDETLPLSVSLLVRSRQS